MSPYTESEKIEFYRELDEIIKSCKLFMKEVIL